MGRSLAVAASLGLLSTLPLPGSALRRQGEGQWPGGFEEEQTETPEPEVYGDLPPFKTFKADFTYRRNMELFSGVADHIHTGPELRMIVGVFTKPYQKMYRDVVRNTWQSQDYVCQLKDGPQEGCNLYTTFAMATPGDGSPLSGTPMLLFDDARSEQDMVVLATTEKNKQAKMGDFLYRMAVEYPWANYIAKMDMQLYLLVPKLITRMHEGRGCRYHYEMMGEARSCNRTHEDSCDMPDFLNKECRPSECRLNGRPFDYIASPFIGMSRDLALKAAHPEMSLMAKRRKLGVNEQDDHAMSRSAQALAWDEDDCIHTWDPHAWYHPQLVYDPDF